MASSTALDRFIKGPLSPCSGGSEAAQVEALACRDADIGQDDDSLADVETPTSVERFVLGSRSPLFSYQQQVVDSLALWLGESRGRGAALVSLPTGAGKTRTGLWFLRQQIEAGSLSRAIWVAPSAELVQQAVDTAKALWVQFPNGPEVRAAVNTLERDRGRNATGPVMAFVTAQLAARRLDDIRRFKAQLLVFR